MKFLFIHVILLNEKLLINFNLIVFTNLHKISLYLDPQIHTIQSIHLFFKLKISRLSLKTSIISFLFCIYLLSERYFKMNRVTNCILMRIDNLESDTLVIKSEKQQKN